VRNDDVREFALRALTDRKTQLEGIPAEAFIVSLGDTNPRVRAQALVSLGRLGNTTVADTILPLTQRTSPLPTGRPFHKQADPGRVLPHLGVQALIALNATDVSLAAIGGPYSDGALWALKYMHNAKAVDGLIARIKTEKNEQLKQQLLTTLIRLYHREGEYKSGWWGTRPDTSGPYYDRKTWSQSEKIAGAIKQAHASASASETAKHIEVQLGRHKVNVKGITAVKFASGKKGKGPQTPLVLPKAAGDNKNLIANMSYEAAAARAAKAKGDSLRGKSLFTQQGCIACHTYSNGQEPKGPHLVDIGKRYKRGELIESILKPSAKIAQGFDTYQFVMDDGQSHIGFVVRESAKTVSIRHASGIAQELAKGEILERKKGTQSMMPVGLVVNLTPEQLADLLAYLESLK